MSTFKLARRPGHGSLLVLAVAALVSMSSAARADEGMWTFDNVPKAAIKARYGIDVTDAWLDHLRLASVRLEGGCSGSFVSPDGLVLTNHHCIHECLLDLSTASDDLVANGFLAKSGAEERRCEGAEVSTLIGLEPVTDKIAAATRGLAGAEESQAREAAKTNLEAACEKAAGASDIRCEVVDLYHGGQFWLYRYRRHSDVRMVFAPEVSIANFGGDPDNFNFPRYDLDMALVRVYEGGKPFRPEHILRFDPEGAKDGEPVFVTGHPGTTNRLLTVDQLDTLRATILPVRLIIASELRGRLIQYGKSSAEALRVSVADLLYLENGLKVRKNQLAALLDPSLVARKRADEEALRRRVAASPDAAVRATASAWDDIAKAEAVTREIYVPFRLIEQREAFGGNLFEYARILVRGAEERTKENALRMREYTDSQLPSLELKLGSKVPVAHEFEELKLAFGLDKLREWLGPDHALVKRVLGSEAPDDVAKRAVRGTKLADPAVRLALWQGGKAAVEASDDPMIALARAVEPDARSLYERNRDEIEGVETVAAEKIARARFAEQGTSVYPDATFTLRLTYGAVEGWDEGSTRVGPFTTLEGVFPRATGKDPFLLPPSWLEARSRIAGKKTFNFVATTDITGGNSGSPVIDRDGRLVGLAFDGNIHSIGGSFWFDPQKNRTVAVDSAGILEALKTIYKADRLVAELLGK